MELIYQNFYNVLECPNIRIKKPTWFKQPSSIAVMVFLMITYFLVTGGILKNVNDFLIYRPFKLLTLIRNNL